MLATGTLKHLLQYNNCWWNYYQQNKASIRPVVVENIIKILSCGTSARGSALYCCPNADCAHTKCVVFTCKSRLCPSCGKKATAAWIQNQMEILPKTSWQHITFTMPRTFWRLFKLNRHLLNKLPALASASVMAIAKGKNIQLGLFTALHTFGRDLKWNPHIHLSTTTGGVTPKQTWKTIWFKKKSLMKAWKYRLISLLREQYHSGTLTLPTSLQLMLPDYSKFNQWLNRQYNKIWIVHCNKPSKNAYHNVNYLGRYIKRPPIAQSRLKHYDGNTVVFNFLNHRNKLHQNYHCTAYEFIDRLIQHIPDKNFRLIRYYGFLANRCKAKMLPIVYKLIGQIVNETLPPRYNHLLKKELICILCGSRLRLRHITIGLKQSQIYSRHKNLAFAKPCMP